MPHPYLYGWKWDPASKAWLYLGSSGRRADFCQYYRREREDGARYRITTVNKPPGSYDVPPVTEPF